MFLFCNNNNAISYSNIKIDPLASNSTQVCANHLNSKNEFLQKMQDSNQKNPENNPIPNKNKTKTYIFWLTKRGS